jgi:hypothetical protein
LKISTLLQTLSEEALQNWTRQQAEALADLEAPSRTERETIELSGR